MTGTELLDEIAAIVGETGNTSYRTKMLRYMNDYYRQLRFLSEAPALIKDVIINVPKMKSAGSVTLTQNSNTVTGVGTSFASTDVGSFLSPSDFKDAFKVTAVSGSLSCTIEASWVRETASAQGYRIFKLDHDLPGDFSKIISLVNGQKKIRIHQRSIQQSDDVLAAPYYQTSSYPAIAVITKNSADYDGTNSTARRVLRILPPPDADYQLRMKYYRDLPELTDGAVYPVFDDANLDRYLVDRTAARLFLDKEDDRAPAYKADAAEWLMLFKNYFENEADNDDRFTPDFLTHPKDVTTIEDPLDLYGSYYD